MQLAAEVGGRVLELTVAEGDRVAAGQVIARLDTRDAELTVARLRADRAQADAQLRLLLAGSRPRTSARRPHRSPRPRPTSRAAESELLNAQADLERYEALLTGQRRVAQGARRRAGAA